MILTGGNAVLCAPSSAEHVDCRCYKSLTWCFVGTLARWCALLVHTHMHRQMMNAVQRVTNNLDRHRVQAHACAGVHGWCTCVQFEESTVWSLESEGATTTAEVATKPACLSELV